MTSRVTALVGALTIRITKSTSRRTGCSTINSPWVSVSTEVLHRLCCCCRTMKTTAMTTIVETTHLYANVDRRPNDIFGLVRTCLDDVHMAGRQWRSLLMQWLHLTSTRRSYSHNLAPDCLSLRAAFVGFDLVIQRLLGKFMSPPHP